MRTTQQQVPSRLFRLRWLWRLGLASISLFLLATLAAAWYYAGQIYSGALRVDLSVHYDLLVVAVDSATITLQPLTRSAARDGALSQESVFGIDWPGGYARAGHILSRGDAGQVTRAFTLGQGELHAGDHVRLDSFAFAHAAEALGRDYQLVNVAGPDGALPAWFYPGSGDTWLISVHGKGSSPAEALRLFSGLPAGTYPLLAISYRNDMDAPASADGRYDYGATEWQDVEAAVRYAHAAGASDVVLVGYSMGGAIILSFLQHSQAAGAVDGLILDAPVLDFEGVIDYAARQRHLPGFLTALAKAIAARHYGIDWSALDYRPTARSTPLPLLLFHGTADKTVPIAASQALAAAAPGRVLLETFAQAGHVRSWNQDPVGYAGSVSTFLDDLPQ